MKLKDSFYYQPYQNLLKKGVSFADYSKKKNYYNQLAFLFEAACSREPYTKREAVFVYKVAKLYRKSPRTFLDISCGTGRHDRELAKKGLAVTGVDGSKALLLIARQKSKGIPYKHSDMRTFTVSHKFDCAFSLWESYNYLSREDDIKRFFQRCAKHINVGGILILDSRNFWRKDLPKKVILQRHFTDAGYDVDLLVRKRTILHDRVHEGLFIYCLQHKNGSQTIIVDQELVRTYTIQDLQRYCGKHLRLVKIFGDFDTTNQYKKAVSKRMIVVFQRV